MKKIYLMLLVLLLFSIDSLFGKEGSKASDSKLLNYHLDFADKLKISEVETYRVIISSDQDLSNEIIYFSFRSHAPLTSIIKQSKTLSGKVERVRLYGNIVDFTLQPDWDANITRKSHKGISDSWQLQEDDNGQIAMFKLVKIADKNGGFRYYGFLELSSFPTNGTYPKKVIDKRTDRTKASR